MSELNEKLFSTYQVEITVLLRVHVKYDMTEIVY